jgi:hypothetical protein
MENPQGFVEWGVWLGPAGIILGRQFVNITIAYYFSIDRGLIKYLQIKLG